MKQVNPLYLNELSEFVAESIVPAIPCGVMEIHLIDAVPDMLDSVLRGGEVRAGRLFDKDGEMVIEPLGVDSLNERKNSAVDRYIVRVDIIVDRSTAGHKLMRQIDERAGEQLKLW